MIDIMKQNQIVYIRYTLKLSSRKSDWNIYICKIIFMNAKNESYIYEYKHKVLCTWSMWKIFDYYLYPLWKW